MKNPHREALRRLAKQYHRHHPLCCGPGGVLTYHLYEGLDPARLTWWDHFAFILNDYKVHVAWIHPRMAFQDRVENEAMQRVSHLSVDLLSREGTPQYKKLGKSRKKAVLWRVGNDDDAARIAVWATAIDQEVARLAHESDLRIQPHMKANWTRYALAVVLCVPVEVRHEADLCRLAELTRRLLKRETTLSREFPGYAYGREHFAEEARAGDGINLLHVMQMA